MGMSFKQNMKSLVKGGLHRNLGVPLNETIPVSKIEAATHSRDPLIRKRANFALAAKKWKH